MSVEIADHVCDFGLSVFANECNAIYICSSPPHTYTEAVLSFGLGVKAGDVGTLFSYPLPEGGSGTGRKVTTSPIVSGTIFAAGTATRWAAVDTVNARLLAQGTLSRAITVRLGQKFNLQSLDIIMHSGLLPPAVSFLPVAVGFSVGAPIFGSPNFKYAPTNLNAANFVSGSPIIGSSTFQRNNILSVPNLDLSVVIGTPSIKQLQKLTAAALSTSALTVPAAIFSQVALTFPLVAASLTTAATSIPAGAMVQRNKLTPVGFGTGVATVGAPTFQQLIPDNTILSPASLTASSPVLDVRPSVSEDISQVSHGQDINATNTGRTGAEAQHIPFYDTTLTTQGATTISSSQTIRNVNFTGKVTVTGGTVLFEFCKFSSAPSAADAALQQYNGGADTGSITCNYCDFDTGLRGTAGNANTYAFEAGDLGNATSYGSTFSLFRCSVQGFGNGVAAHKWLSSGSTIRECYIANLTVASTSPAPTPCGIELLSAEFLTVDRNRIVVSSTAESCIKITPAGDTDDPTTVNPVVVSDNYINGGFSPVSVRWSDVGSAVTSIVNVRFTGNRFGDLAYYGRECDFHDMFVTFDQNYALSNPTLIYWSTSNVWALNGEGITDPATSPSGQATAGRPHTAGNFVSEVNFYSGEISFTWDGAVSSPGSPVVTPQDISIPTSTTLDQLIVHVTATNSPISYAIVGGNDNNYFAIYPSGNLRTSESIQVPDGIYNLSITATNGSGTSIPAAFNVGIAAIAPVVVDSSFSLSLPATAGTVVGTVSATGGVPSSWAITGGDTSNFFAINNSGVLTVTSAGASGLTANTYNLTVQATNQFGSDTGSCTVNATAASNAQYPTLLNGYARRPSWQVVGVDAYVGLPAGTTLKAPSTATLPSGVTRNTTTRVMTVTANNVVIDGWDFSQNNGWLLTINGNNCIVQNCNFKVGGTNSQSCVFCGTTATGTEIKNCSFDGSLGFAANVAALVTVRGTVGGTIMNFHDNFLASSPADSVQFIGVTGKVTVERNLYKNGVYFSGAHADFIQFSDAGSLCTVEPTVRYNTLYLTYFSGNTPGEGIQIEAQVNNCVINNGEIAYNTIVSTGTDPNCGASNLLVCRDDGGTNKINTIVFHDNYMDARGTYVFANGKNGFYYTGNIDGAPGLTWNNYNMVTGLTVRSSFSTDGNTEPANPPAAPVVSSAVQAGSAVTLNGTGPASRSIDVFIDNSNVPTGRVTSTAGGLWTYTTPALSAGTHFFNARATDSSNNASALSNTVSNSTAWVAAALITGSPTFGVPGFALIGGPMAANPLRTSSPTIGSPALSQSGTDSPQMPNLLNGYALRPPAGTVPGVDYFVGCPSSVTLKSVATATLPTGVSRDTSQRIITVSNSNVIMDGWNFNVSGGYRLYVRGNSCTVRNCKFGGAAASVGPPILFQVIGGTGMQTVDQCTIDAASADSSNWPGSVSQDSRDNNLTVTNCYIANSGSDGISAGGGTQIYKNNFFYNTGTGEPSGAHPDLAQNTLTSPATRPSWDVQFNCSYGPNFPIQGFIIANQTYSNATVSNNVFIGKAGSAFVGAQASCAGVLTVQNNYADVTAGGFWYPGSTSLAGGASHCSFANNRNMVNGSSFTNNP